MKALKIFSVVLLFILLTILSQVGGIILLLWILIFRYFKAKLTKPWAQRTINAFGFMVFYMIFNLLIIPFLAGLGGKVRLPMSKSGNLVPVTYWTAIFMRNYITEEGKEKLLKIADEFAQKYPGLQVKYMDCNYPFNIPTPTIPKGYISKKEVETFPLTEGLIPHISHFGNKADIALVYTDETGKPSNLTPTAIGYGSSVDPLPDEPGYANPKCGCKTNHQSQRKDSKGKINEGTPCMCDKEYVLYSFMYHIIPINKSIKLSKIPSASLINRFYKFDKEIILEAHLRKRLEVLQYSWGNHPCSSVRHDDHFHVKF